MNARLIEKDGLKYVEYSDAEAPMKTESDALSLVSSCFEYGAKLLMLGEQGVSRDFFELGTGLAGAALLKFSTYGVKVAMIVTTKKLLKGRFGEFALETNKGQDFRIYPDAEDAEAWLRTQM